MDCAALLTSVDLAQLANTLALIRRQVALAHEAVDVFGGALQFALLHAGTHIFLFLLATFDLTFGNGAVHEGGDGVLAECLQRRRCCLRRRASDGRQNRLGRVEAREWFDEAGEDVDGVPDAVLDADGARRDA